MCVYTNEFISMQKQEQVASVVSKDIDDVWKWVDAW